MAKDGGRTDYWAPESDLDPVEPGVWYKDADGLYFEVCQNDFVDIDIEGVMPEDPIWGSSFQVLEMNPRSITVRGYSSESDLYAPIEVSIELVLDIYKRRPHLDAPPEGATVFEGE